MLVQSAKTDATPSMGLSDPRRTSSVRTLQVELEAQSRAL